MRRQAEQPVDRRRLLGGAAAVAGAALLGGCRAVQTVSAAGTPVQVERVPDGGLQPQAVVDEHLNVHLVYLKGQPGSCDVLYRRREAGKSGWGEPLTVNTIPGSAIAAGTIRGAQLALGKGDRVHVAWNGSKPVGVRGAPLYHTRLKDDRSGFEPQRDVSRTSVDLDGGASLAADARGSVYVAWHAGPTKGLGEGARKLWLTRSGDEGKTFGPEETVWEDPTGACACCSVKIFATARGEVFLFYRAATERVNRDMVFLASADGRKFRGGRIDPWVINACPMSSESFVTAGNGTVWGAWETAGQVRMARVDGTTGKLGRHISAPGPAAGRKHPFLAVNGAGNVLLVWDEGTGWQRGGDLAWQLYDAAGAPLPTKGRVTGGIPVWGLATAVPVPGGGFLILH